MISFEAISFAYPNEVLFKDFTAEIGSGQIVSILGPSGRGKTTLLLMIAGVIQPNSGQVRIDGAKPTLASQEIGLVFQDVTLFQWRSVIDNVLFGERASSSADALLEANTLIQAVGLANHGHKLPAQLSGGMQKRLALARALANGPRVLLLDEPFGSLDTKRRWEMQDLLLALHLKHQLTIVLVTHDIDEAIAVSDKIFVLSPIKTEIETIDVPFERPRHRKAMLLDIRYAKLRERLLELQ